MERSQVGQRGEKLGGAEQRDGEKSGRTGAKRERRSCADRELTHKSKVELHRIEIHSTTLNKNKKAQLSREKSESAATKLTENSLHSSVLMAGLSAPKLAPMKLFCQEQASSEAMLKAIGEPSSKLKQNHKKKGVNHTCGEQMKSEQMYIVDVGTTIARHQCLRPMGVAKLSLSEPQRPGKAALLSVQV
ncbi:hypothetical protein STEG23_033489 [Scotinomys teguina]